jgi:hypothetical protein
VVPNRKREAIQAEVREHVEAGSALYTDALKSYDGLNEFEHQVVDHAIEYVRGERISGRPFILFRYLGEQTFRFNNRKDGQPLNDGDPFDMTVGEIADKRLTWDRLTGKDGNAGSLQGVSLVKR